MADSDVVVTVSGAAFSFLFYENVRSSGNQMGFLLGDMLFFITKNVTDSDRETCHEKKQINISSIVACPQSDVFHNTKGTINIEKIKRYIQENGKRVVGWFRFRRNRNLVPTMRDKILHKELSKLFKSRVSSEENFVMCLLNSSVSENRGTHKFQHVFLRYNNRSMVPLPLRICNLGNVASSYIPAPAEHSVIEPDHMSRLIQKIPLCQMSEVEAIKNIESLAKQELSNMIPELCRSEQEVARLEKEISEVQERIRDQAMRKENESNSQLTLLDAPLDDLNYSEHMKVDTLMEPYKKHLSASCGKGLLPTPGSGDRSQSSVNTFGTFPVSSAQDLQPTSCELWNQFRNKSEETSVSSRSNRSSQSNYSTSSYASVSETHEPIRNSSSSSNISRTRSGLSTRGSTGQHFSDDEQKI